MPFLYTRDTLQSDINRGIQGKIGMLIAPVDTMNEAVRTANNDFPLRSRRRRQLLVPNLLNGDAMYQCASDLDAYRIIDIPAQAKRADGEFSLVPTEQYARESRPGDIAIDDYNGVRVIYVRSRTPDLSASIDPLSSLSTSPSGEWQAFGDADDLAVDTDNFIKGSATITFDIDGSGGTMAGIFNNALDHVDLSGYIGKLANVFSYALVTSATNLTNFKLRLGISSTIYWEFTVTAQADGTTFAAGWNPLRFDLSSLSAHGGIVTTDAADITYSAIFMTKTTGKINEVGYGFNWLEARKGAYAYLKYYTKYGWNNAAGAYLENSTDVSDVVVADTDEYDLIVKKGRFLAAQETDLGQAVIDAKEADYLKALTQYKMQNPSEEKVAISTYWDYGSRGGLDNDDFVQVV